MGTLSEIVPRKKPEPWITIADYACYNESNNLCVAPWHKDLEHFVKSEILDNSRLVATIKGGPTFFDCAIAALIEQGKQMGLPVTARGV